MAGYLRGSKAHEDMLAQRFANDLKKIYEKAPETKDEIVVLTKHISELLDAYVESVRTQKVKCIVYFLDENNQVTRRES